MRTCLFALMMFYLIFVPPNILFAQSDSETNTLTSVVNSQTINIDNPLSLKNETNSTKSDFKFLEKNEKIKKHIKNKWLITNHEVTIDNNIDNIYLLNNNNDLNKRIDIFPNDVNKSIRPITYAALSKNGKFVVVKAKFQKNAGAKLISENVLEIFDDNGGKKLEKLLPSNIRENEKMHISDDGKVILTNLSKGEIRLFDLNNSDGKNVEISKWKDSVKDDESEPEILTHELTTPDGKYIAISRSDYRIFAGMKYELMLLDFNGGKIWEKVIDGIQGEIRTATDKYILVQEQKNKISNEKFSSMNIEKSYLICFDLNNGKKLWQADLTKEGVYLWPEVINSNTIKVYTSDNKNNYEISLNASNGKILSIVNITAEQIKTEILKIGVNDQ